MRIEIDAQVGMVTTKNVPCKRKRKGYYRGDTYIKAKTFIRYKKIKIKNPYLSGTITLTVYDDLILGGIYEDQRGEKYLCVNKMHIGETKSFLKNATTSIRDNVFISPKSLICVVKTFPERTT